ncbi:MULTISPECIES: iron ABC transporter permease [unclassified Breznakia]|uniref:ABC transporter permease n=1 Tax=unclassified Breznakia TaxID=2623764 RepID=UPI002476D45A|nr:MULTISPECIES: iron ABC transporter permease [unclassified Breznakia]MDH6367345.1 iron(III) transport system permease protein [Breznakia sp. PH1-1]MDH6404507.1 iron(III) transport system permease protein [Breznakia sp. PF1-11]MDH6412216.1 iron(III) transport system permease protein [Breznakia sp. PFB1-11]MDH6414512.1 iron(III) transport system permease protein [Breznakia sp. PFB1-14]MDH6416880.1 iron(III) transport system permease protein [Breznakia sp. PFB1-4]
MTNTKKRDIWTYVSIGLAALFILFLVFPLGKLLKEAVYTNGEFSLDAFVKFFQTPYYYTSIFNSTKVALTVTALSLLLGIPFSYFYTFFKMRGKKILFVLVLLSTMSAPFIGAYAWVLLMGNSGLITEFLAKIGITDFSIYGFGGIVFVQSMKLFPLVVIYMNGAFKDIDNSLLEAAESMNCTGLKKFKEVIMSLTMPTILAAALLVFMRSFADFGTPVLIGRGYSTFPVLIYQQFLGENGTDYHFASAISVIAILVTGLIFIIQKYATNKFKFTINAMHPVHPKKAKRFQNMFMHGFNYMLVALAMLPQFYVINMSFRNYRNSILQPGYSLVNYQKAMEKDLFRSLGNTLLISVVTLTVVIIIAVLIAYLVVRRKNAFNNAIDVVSMLPYVMPGGVIGIAMIIAFSGKPFYLTGTIAIMVIALVIRRMPFTSRSATAAMMKIPESIEEAGISLGASKLQTFVKVTIPMMSSGIIAGAVLSWVSIITEMSSGVMLYNNKTITLTLSAYAAINNGTYGVAAVFATITTIFTIISLVIYLKFAKTEDVSV